MMQKKDFSVFFDKMAEIKIGLNYYTNFQKVIDNITQVSDLDFKPFEHTL